MSYAHVKLLNGFPELLTYRIPNNLLDDLAPGSLVHVPLQRRTEIAIVDSIVSTIPPVTFKVRDILHKEPFPQDHFYHAFIQQLSAYYCIEPLTLYQRIRTFLAQDAIEQEKLHAVHSAPSVVTLTTEQQKIVDTLVPQIAQPSYQPILIHGVTGSGKTLVYKALIEQALTQQKSALLLLPEVSLAVQFTKLLRTQLDARHAVLGFHSATGVKEKRLLWQLLLEGKPLLIIGVHLPVLLPIKNLGLIIIDEEHEVGYQEKKHPRINTKEAALMRAQKYAIPIILGSATPSVASLYNVKNRGWEYFQITKRFSGAFPKIQVVNLLEKQKRKHFWISNELFAALETCLQRKEQALIFINRRGYSFFVQCKSCSFIFSCNACSVSLTFHEGSLLQCHYCGLKRDLPNACDSCLQTDLLKKGIGTQQVVAILQKLFPHAHIARADLDATINKKKWQATLEQFSRSELDILVGTQTITKGYHFPNVTVVGILWADVNLSFPVYHAAESTLQQLIQVAGRAGRQRPESLVIVQTLRDHKIFGYLNEAAYTDFYNYEMHHRMLTGYPPQQRFAEIELRHIDIAIIEREAAWCVEFLQCFVRQRAYTLTILGPAQPPVHKIKNVCIRKIYLKGASIAPMLQAYHALAQQSLKISLFFTPQPLA